MAGGETLVSLSQMITVAEYRLSGCALVPACADGPGVRVGLAVPRGTQDRFAHNRLLGGAMAVPPRSRLLSVLQAERFEADGAVQYRSLAAHDKSDTTSAIDGV